MDEISPSDLKQSPKKHAILGHSPLSDIVLAEELHDA